MRMSILTTRVQFKIGNKVLEELFMVDPPI